AVFNLEGGFGPMNGQSLQSGRLWGRPAPRGRGPAPGGGGGLWPPPPARGGGGGRGRRAGSAA
ncbi:hypothetical protein PVA98_16105, partial [Achromobacter xylosoxidans]|nr:hypothetical protein [Achromobacter xylosoxidans]